MAEFEFRRSSISLRQSVPQFPQCELGKGKAQLGYQSTVIQSGVSYEIAKWQGRDGAYTAFDLMGSARYWNEEVDVSLKVTGTLTADIEELGLGLSARNRSLSQIGYPGMG